MSVQPEEGKLVRNTDQIVHQPPDQANRRARMLLTHVVEPGSEQMGALLEHLSPAEVVPLLRESDDQLTPPVLAAAGLSVDTLRLWRARLVDAPRRLERTQRHHQALGVRFVAPGEPEWPTQLDQLGPTRPLGLWVRGRADLRLWALRSVSVVGARANTDYGLSVTRQITADMAQRGWTVVSGAAYGIDAAAHHATLSVAGRTIAVLACGVDVVYPPCNADLLREVAHQGLIISEFPSGERVYRSRFLQRNRIIAALTRGSLIVEAALRSGALNTANHAARLNRQVMAVPGPVHSSMSAGCHELIRTGVANLASDARDVLDLIAGLGECEQPQRRADATLWGGEDSAAPQLPALRPEHAQVLAALGLRVSRDLADLVARTDLPLPTLTAALGTLEAQGRILTCPGGWRRVSAQEGYP